MSTQTLELFRSIVFEVTGKPVADDITPQSAIAELGVDSVAFTEIVTRIEESLDMEVPMAEWMRARTVQELIDTISQAGRQP